MDAEAQLNCKHFKCYYSGKPTKRYLKCRKQIDEAEGTTLFGSIASRAIKLLIRLCRNCVGTAQNKKGLHPLEPLSGLRSPCRTWTYDPLINSQML